MPPEQEQFFQQIDSIIKSHSLRGSESLCRLLQYLAKQSLYQPHAPLKEYQIATEVYGRPADFDPHTDSTIRVQVGRLRLKLAEYYATEGTTDPIVVKIPKGSYHLTFEARSVPGRPVDSEAPPQGVSQPEMHCPGTLADGCDLVGGRFPRLLDRFGKRAVDPQMRGGHDG